MSAIVMDGLWLMELTGQIKHTLAILARCIAVLLNSCLAEFVVKGDAELLCLPLGEGDSASPSQMRGGTKSDRRPPHSRQGLRP